MAGPEDESTSLDLPLQPTQTPEEYDIPLVMQQLPTNILPSNGDILAYYNSKKRPGVSMDVLSKSIAEEVIATWKKASIPTMDLLNVKNDVIKKVIQRGMKKKSKISQTRNNIHGYLNSPADCCIISKCRHFLKAKNKEDIDPNFCNCLPKNRIPASRIPFFKNQLFDRKTKELIKISDLPTENVDEDNIKKNGMLSGLMKTYNFGQFSFLFVFLD